MPPTSNKKEDEGISIWRFITARHLLQRGGSRTLRESLRLTWGKPPERAAAGFPRNAMALLQGDLD